MKKIFFSLFISSLIWSCTYDEGEMPDPGHHSARCDSTFIIHATSSYTFSPQIVNVYVGDTIKWIYDSDNQDEHTTTSATIPGGASSWDDTLNSSNQSFFYVITEAGTYDYVCTPHSPDMHGTIIATLPPRGMHTIHAQSSYTFSPQQLNVQVGDTIQWVWDNDNVDAHTTTSTTVPMNAVSWDNPLDSTNTSFLYVINQAGTYNYVCTPHAPDMNGTIIATKCK